jgi:hypothetical protein
MKHIIINTWNGQDLDNHNSAYVTDVSIDTFKNIAYIHMKDMDATSMERNGDDYFSFTCKEDNYCEDHGSISYVLYNGEYGVHIMTNSNEFELLTKEEWDAEISNHDEKDSLGGEDFMSDDGEYFHIFIKL